MFRTTSQNGTSSTAATRTATSTTRTTRKGAKALAAAAVLTATAVTGVVATAGPANAATVVGKPWKHTITVETTNVHVHQHNWIRADVDRWDGYRVASFSYNDGNGGNASRWTPFAESTGGFFNLHSADRTVDGSQWNTVRYDGSVSLQARVDMTVDGPNAPWPSAYRDSGYDLPNLAANSTTGWRHVEVVGAGGDYVAVDYKVTNTASPQS